ncbi:MAG: ribonuclease III family protein [Solirubrobacteraceae bacterium]
MARAQAERRRPRRPAAEASVAGLRALLDELPDELASHVFTHASWTSRRSGSYERLAFLGDSVLSLAITSHLYPSLEAERFGAGELTKIRAQTVSGRSCRAVAERLSVPERVAAVAPAAAIASVSGLVSTERVLASITEAIIGACYLAFGYERVAPAVVDAFEPLLADALEHPVDFKSALQERLARRGAVVIYEVVGEEGQPHDRTFTILAMLEDEEIGRGIGRSKKDAEQAAARAALEHLDGPALRG